MSKKQDTSRRSAVIPCEGLLGFELAFKGGVKAPGNPLGSRRARIVWKVGEGSLVTPDLVYAYCGACGN
jgi:hypothetical protein